MSDRRFGDRISGFSGASETKSRSGVSSDRTANLLIDGGGAAGQRALLPVVIPVCPAFDPSFPEIEIMRSAVQIEHRVS